MLSDMMVAGGDIVWWSLTLAVLIPLLVIVLGEAIERLRKRDSVYVEPYETLRNVFVPALTFMLIATQVIDPQPIIIPGADGADPQVEGTLWTLLSRIVQTVFWFTLALTALSFLSAITQAGKADRTRWEARMPTITRTIGRAVAIILPFALVVATVWELDLTRYLAAIGVGSIAIAFALQNTLSSVISGVLLALDKPFKEGDWIEVDGHTGQVIDLNWRTTRIMVEGRDIVVIPNTTLLDSTLKNYTTVDEGYRDRIDFGFAYDNMPNLVKDVALQVARECPLVADSPPAEVHTVEYGDSSVNYAMHFHVATYMSPFAAARIREELMTRLFYAAARHDLEIPFPIRTLRETHTGDMTDAERMTLAMDALRANPATAAGSAKALRRLATMARVADFGRGTPVSEASVHDRTVSLVRHGRVGLQTPEGQDVMELGPGALLGMRQIVGNRTNRLRAVALEDVELVRFPSDAVMEAMRSDPALARSLNAHADELLGRVDLRLESKDAAE